MPPIVIVGEAWGEQEAHLGHPFVGPAGRELVKLLCEANILPRPQRYPWEPTDVRDFWLLHSDAVTLTNVFNFRPERNDIETLCVGATGHHVDGPPLRAGKYVAAIHQPELDRLARELTLAAPNLVIALGGTASWALLGAPGISRIRGTVTRTGAGPARDVGEGISGGDLDEMLQQQEQGSVAGRESCGRVLQGTVAGPADQPPTGVGFKCLPTYHPAAILRDWSLRAVTVLDLLKGQREAQFPDIRRPRRSVLIEPTLEDLEWFWTQYLSVAEYLSVDIETQGTHITCIGFAPSPAIAIVVPFRDLRNPSWSYWPSATAEARAWQWVRKVCTCPIPKLFQNGMYDAHFLWAKAGIPTNVDEDTMLLHHSLYPELQKGLGFLGSVYTNEASWKLMARSASRKKDE